MKLRALLPLLLVVVAGSACGPRETPAPSPSPTAVVSTPTPVPTARSPAPRPGAGRRARRRTEFRVKFETTKGPFVIEVHRAWAPLAADRFYNLVRLGYYDDVTFFRVIDDFMVQFGIHGDPEVSAVWRDARIPDDPPSQSNARGMVTFAHAGPGTRTTQIFINFKDNSMLDAQGFPPFGKVVEGMTVVDELYSGYGEGAPRGAGPRQDRAQSEGNPYFRERVPEARPHQVRDPRRARVVRPRFVRGLPYDGGVSPRTAAPPFRPAVREWFAQTFAAPTKAQRLGWPSIAGGESTLILAPTGSGKTLAAFLAAIDRLMFAPVPPEGGAVPGRLRLSPQGPGGGRRAQPARADPGHRPGGRAARRGGPPARGGHPDRRHPRPTSAPHGAPPPDILITTPESLFLILTARAREILASVETVIVDEIHALVGTKRGAHLALSLERLEEVAGRPLQRIGLSATQRPLDEVARYLGGGSGKRTWTPRPVAIVDAGAKKAFDLRVEVPVEDMSRLGEAVEPAPGEVPEGPASALERRSIWPAIQPRLLELVRAHRSTIVFVNSRRLAERLAAALNELAGEPVARAHHGSVAREQRLEIEDALKAGRLPALVATSSLELGIDMGAVDLVIQIETPTSVASGIQRIGRASHQVEAVSRGVIFPKYRGDLLASAAITQAMKQGAVEETRVPAEPPRRPRPAGRGDGGAGGAPGRRAVRPRSPGGALRRPAAERSSRASSTCSPGATPRTSSRSCGPASSGTGSGGRCGPGRAPSAWR